MRTYLLALGMGSVVCTAAWIMVVLNIDPDEAGAIGYVLFYSTLGLSIIGWVSVMNMVVRTVLARFVPAVSVHIFRIFRQSCFVAVFFLSALALMQFNYLRWWNGVILVALGIVLEGMVYTNRTSRT